MQFNIKSQIRKLSNRINLSSVINEAVVNSIQAKATEIKLIFYREDKQQELLDTKPKITGLDIVDNGDGFKKENIESFSTYGSELKLESGCKGIGRLCFLKVFDSVTIESLISEEKRKVNVNFTDQFEKKDFKIISAPNVTENKTTISFRSIKRSFQKNWEIVKIKEDLYNHILPLLYLTSERKIKITIVDNSDGVEEEIKTEDLPNFEKMPFTVKEFITKNKEDVHFTLHYSFVEQPNASNDILSDFYCGNKRTVCGFKDKDLNINPLKRHKVILLLTSDFLDRSVNDERDDFDIYPKLVTVEYPLSWEMINEKLKENIKDILYKKYPEFELENKKITKHIREENLHLIDYLENVDSLGGLIDSETIIERAEDLYAKDKANFRKELKNEKENNGKSINKFQLIEKASDLAGKELIEYVTTRDKVISQLELLDLNIEENEEVIRSHILKKGLEGYDYTPIPVKENKLWLIDDKFMTYNYVASEKAISTLLKNIGLPKNGSNEEIDIVLYSNSKDAKRAVLIEMKKFSAGYKENGEGISQLSIYAEQLEKAGVEELYLYLIATVDDKFRTNLINLFKFTKVFSQGGEIYHGTLSNVNAYIQIISPKALISDARARNKTFIDIIKNLNGLQD